MGPKTYRPNPPEQVGAHGAGSLYRYTAGPLSLPVLHVQGSPRQMGHQYGALAGGLAVRQAKRVVALFTNEGLPEELVKLFLSRSWALMSPYVPAKYLEEMEAVAEGAAEAGHPLALDDLERIMAVTNLDLYKRETRIADILGEETLSQLDAPVRDFIEALRRGVAMSCTMLAVWGSRTQDGRLYSFRNLDWLSQSGMHEERLVTLYEPSEGLPFVTMGYAGAIGAIAGMNAAGVSISEVGAFSVAEELDGMPWVLLARRILEEAGALNKAQEIVARARHTLGYNYLVAFGDPAKHGTDAYAPGAFAAETNHQCCEIFGDNARAEREAVYTDPSGKATPYGAPLPEAVMRADTAFGKSTRALQAADNGPGEETNTGDPHFESGEAQASGKRGSTYTNCHLPMHAMVRAYEKGEAYTFPVRGQQVIEAGEPRRIGPEEMLNIAATVAHNTEMLEENDWNVMSVVYAPTDLQFWVAYEHQHQDSHWTNAPDTGYIHFDLKTLLGRDRNE